MHKIAHPEISPQEPKNVTCDGPKPGQEQRVGAGVQIKTTEIDRYTQSIPTDLEPKDSCIDRYIFYNQGRPVRALGDA